MDEVVVCDDVAVCLTSNGDRVAVALTDQVTHRGMEALNRRRGFGNRRFLKH